MNEQNYSKKKLHNTVLKAYPNSVILKIKKSKHYHSNTYHLTILDSDANCIKEILLKKYHTKPFSQILNEYTNQSSFYFVNGESNYTTPKPIMIDKQTHSILMEFINGTSVKSTLLSNESHQDMITSMSRCATLLYSYQNVFTTPDDAPIIINSPYMGTISQENIFSLYKTCKNINLTQTIKPFLDFSPWNIINSGEKVFLIDFPEVNGVCTSHIDIARFIFCMNIIKNTPNFYRLKLKQDWDFNDACCVFLTNYLNLQNAELNNDDEKLIEFFYKQYSKYLLRKLLNSSKPIEKLQYYYINKYINKNIDGKLMEMMTAPNY